MNPKNKKQKSLLTIILGIVLVFTLVDFSSQVKAAPIIDQNSAFWRDSFDEPNAMSGISYSENLTVSQGDVKLTLNLNLGDGSDGTLTVSSANTIVNNYTYITNANLYLGNTTINVNNANEFLVGDEILIIQMQNSSGGAGVSAGNYEFGFIKEKSSNQINLTSGLTHNYTSGTFDSTSSDVTQIVRVPHYTNVTINSGASITAKTWDGYSGGIIIFRATGTVNVTGSINVTGKGFRGGNAITTLGQTGKQGESINGNPQIQTMIRNIHAGGGGPSSTSVGRPGGGAGGSYGSAGGTRSGQQGTNEAGTIIGIPSLSTLYLGGAGGGGGSDDSNCGTSPVTGNGGSGGGIILLFSNNLTVSGKIVANGGEGTSGTSCQGAGGGGSGGSIYFIADNLNVGTNGVNATGGPGGIMNDPSFPDEDGADGGNGRIRIDYISKTGSTNPSAGYNKTIPYYTTGNLISTLIQPSSIARWDRFYANTTLGWKYKKQINISNSGSALTDYQVNLTVDTTTLISQEKMQSTCNDTRFYDSNGNNLSYWIESPNYGTQDYALSSQGATCLGGTNCGYAIDGTYSTSYYWYVTAAQNENLYLLGTIDLEQIKSNIGKIQLHLWDGDGRYYYNYKVEVSPDNLAWETWFDGTGSGINYRGLQTITHSPENIRYIKIWVSGNTVNAGGHIIEVYAYNTTSGCNTTSTKIWVKVPSIPSGGTNIFMYYGNPDAFSESQQFIQLPDWATIRFVEIANQTINLTSLKNQLTVDGISYTENNITCLPYYNASGNLVYRRCFNNSINFTKSTSCSSINHFVFVAGDAIIIGFSGNFSSPNAQNLFKYGGYSQNVMSTSNTRVGTYHYGSGTVCGTTYLLDETLNYVHNNGGTTSSSSAFTSTLINSDGYLLQAVQNEYGTSASSGYTHFDLQGQQASTTFAWFRGCAAGETSVEFPEGTWYTTCGPNQDETSTVQGDPTPRLLARDQSSTGTAGGGTLAIIGEFSIQPTEIHSFPDQSGYDWRDENYIVKLYASLEPSVSIGNEISGSYGAGISDITFKILNESNSTLCNVSSEDAYSGYNITNCTNGYYFFRPIKLSAFFTTSDASFTPTLSEWNVSWELNYPPTINFNKPSSDNSTLVAKWFKQNITVTDVNLYWLNCSVYNSTQQSYWSREWNLTELQSYNVNDIIDISSWPLGLYYENCTVMDLTER